MVHSHLYWPTFIARLATPRNIPLLTTIHTSIGYTRDYKKWYIRALDRWSYKYKKSTIIAVAQTVKEQYFSILKLKPGPAYVLYTFVDTTVFKGGHEQPANNTFRLITIGTLRYPKNHELLVTAFAKLGTTDISLDIYGSGPLKEKLEAMINASKAKVNLMGQVANLQDIIPAYDLYIMASEFEGFSLSVLEAMAMGMPLLLSDIPSFREQCKEAALYFKLGDAGELARTIQELAGQPALLKKLGVAAKERVTALFTLDHHMKQLKDIYDTTLGKN